MEFWTSGFSLARYCLLWIFWEWNITWKIFALTFALFCSLSACLHPPFITLPLKSILKKREYDFVISIITFSFYFFSLYFSKTSYCLKIRMLHILHSLTAISLLFCTYLPLSHVVEEFFSIVILNFCLVLLLSSQT